MKHFSKDRPSLRDTYADTFAEKTREDTIMSEKRKCPSCSSTKLEPGKMQSTGSLYFRPENTKFLTLGTNDIQVSGNMCMDCGHVMLVGDLRKASKVLGKTEAH